MIHTLTLTYGALLQTDTAAAARFQLIARRARETYGRVEKLITWRREREMQFRSPCGSILLLTFYLVPDKAPPLKKTKLGREL
jgi:hypothetical protein